MQTTDKVKSSHCVHEQARRAVDLLKDAQGRVGVPILLYLLGAPGFLCILVWALFFRGK